MIFILCVLAVVTALASYFFTGFLTRKIKNYHIVSHVTSRSAHIQPTPVGGGISIVVLVLLSCLIFGMFVGFQRPFVIAYLPAALCIAVVGFWDDVKGISAINRLAAYALASFWATWMLGPVTHFTFPGHSLDLGYLAFPLTFLFILWMINLFNFMDGINGLISGFTCFFGIVFALFSWNPNFETSVLAIVLGGSALGFLPWNFPRARVFLGDVGSVFIGFTLAVILVYNAKNTDLVAAGLILLVPLTVDSTMTLLMRFFKRENVFKAHNKHLYQRTNLLLESHT